MLDESFSTTSLCKSKGLMSLTLLILYGHALLALTSDTVLENGMTGTYDGEMEQINRMEIVANKSVGADSLEPITDHRSSPISHIIPGTVTRLDEKDIPKSKQMGPEAEISNRVYDEGADRALIPDQPQFLTNGPQAGTKALENGVRQQQHQPPPPFLSGGDTGEVGDVRDNSLLQGAEDAQLVDRSAVKESRPLGTADAFGDIAGSFHWDEDEDGRDADNPRRYHGDYGVHRSRSRPPQIIFTGRRVLQEEGSGQECVLATNSGCRENEECIRRHKFDICECKKTHGRRFHHRHSKCKPIKFGFGVVFQLLYKFDVHFEDESSKEFVDFSQIFLDIVDQQCRSNPILNQAVVSNRIIKMEDGSTIVYISVDIGQDNVVPVETLASLLREAFSRPPPNDIGLWANSLQSLAAYNLCDKPETNPCSKNGECLRDGLDFLGCRCNPGYEDVSTAFLYPGAICSKSQGACEVGTNSGCGTLQVCVNIDGSNACICQPPFMKDVFTGDCKVATSCDSTNNFGCGLNEICQPQNFGSTCICAPGYTRNLLNGQCEAKPGDECDIQTQIGCKVYAREKCVDVSGRGVCLCIYGYSRNPNTLRCERVSSQCDAELNTGCPPTEKCEWYDNITVCNCLAGYVRNALTQKCQSDTATIRVRIHLLLVYVPGLENVYSPSFQQLQNILLEAFWYVVSRNPELNQAILDIVILRFLPGSIIADTRFIIQSSANVSGNYIKETIQNSIIPPEPVFQSLRFKDATIEDVEEESPCSDPNLNYCSSNATCYPKGSVYSCKCLPGYRDTSTPGLTGERCEMECSDIYCTSNGRCSFERNKKKCKCSVGYYGKACQINGIAILVTLVITLLLVITLAITMVVKSKSRGIKNKNTRVDGDNFARKVVGKEGKKRMKGIADKSKAGASGDSGGEQGESVEAGKYRKFSIGSERPNLVEVMSSRGDNIESSATTSAAAGPNFVNTMAPNQQGTEMRARDLNSGSPLRIITRNSFRQVGKNEEYTPWWHSENTETEGSFTDDSPTTRRLNNDTNGNNHTNTMSTNVEVPLIHEVRAPPLAPRLPG